MIKLLSLKKLSSQNVSFVMVTSSLLKTKECNGLICLFGCFRNIDMNALFLQVHRLTTLQKLIVF